MNITSVVDTKNDKIHIREFIDNDSINVEVYDPESLSATLRQIFKPFITIKSVGQGRGLGLAICKNILQEIDEKVNFSDIIERDKPSDLATTTMSNFLYGYELNPTFEKQFHNSTNVPSHQGVPLYSILESGSIVFAILCLLSLSIWLSQNIPLINPFIAILGLIASPFFYWMGRVLRKKRFLDEIDDYAVTRI